MNFMRPTLENNGICCIQVYFKLLLPKAIDALLTRSRVSTSTDDDADVSNDAARLRCDVCEQQSRCILTPDSVYALLFSRVVRKIIRLKW